jgi:CHAT domain-containing protein/tetratricopeptide (TPR) repeat protein
MAKFLLLALFAVPMVLEQPAGLRHRVDEVVAAFGEGNVARLMTSWSTHAPSRPADEERLSRLLDDRASFDLSAGEATGDGGRAVVRFELRDHLEPGKVLERYDVELQLESGDWRVRSFTSTEAERATKLLAANGAERGPLTEAADVPLVRELLNRGGEQLSAGKADPAQAAFTLAAELADRIHDRGGRAAAARGLGQVQSMRGDMAAARRYYESSIEIAGESGDRRATAKSLHYLGLIDRVTGDNASAEKDWSTALDLFRQTDDRAGQAIILNALGNLRSGLGDYAGSRSRFEESQRLYEELHDPIGVSVVLNNLGIDYRLQGAYPEALATFRRARDLSRSANDEDGVAYADGNIGNVLSAQGDYVDALGAYHQALAVHERLHNNEAVAATLSGIGETYSVLGNYPQAVSYLQQSFAAAEKAASREETATAVHNLGEVWSRQGDSRRALASFQKSLTIDTEVENRAGMAIDLNDIAQAQAELGHLHEAHEAFGKSLLIAEEINDRETMTLVLANQAELALHSKSPSEGLPYAERAMTMATAIGLRNRLWEAHAVTGRLYRRLGRLPEARVELDAAVAIVEELRRGIPGDEMAEQAFESMVAPYQELVGVLVEQGDVAAAFEYAERAKARVLLDVLRHGRPDVGGAMSDEERRREGELVAALGQLNRDFRDKVTGGEAGAAAAADLSAKLRKGRLDYEDFLTGLYAAHPELRIARGEIPSIRAGDLDAILAGRAADAILEFVVSEEKTYLFVITRNPGGAAELRVHTIATGQRDLAREVRRFRELLAGRDLTYAASARALYDRLLRPAESQIGSARVVCIVGDGPLWELPFQALQPSASQFVIDRHALFYTPSVTVLREMRVKPPAAGVKRPVRLLAFGNPLIPTAVASRVADAYRDVSLAPIPETEREIREIAALYGADNSRVHLRGGAREEVFKREAADFDVLHFATHGILDDQNAMYSRLLLSPAHSGAEDGFLEAREIMGLKLHARLAVLSACDTARGRVGAGEGMIGMSWALFVAGCPTSVVSQWKVSSASTTELMIELHRALRSGDDSGRSAAEALRHAALSVRSKAAYRHPFYWAAFVVVGEGR